MRAVVEKLLKVERQIAEEKGPFSLFALFLREDAQDKWDLVASALWLEKNKQEAFEFLANLIRSSLAPDELLSLSRIVLVDHNDPALDAVHRALRAEHGIVEVKDTSFFGLEIKHAYIITSQRETETVTREVT
jgi:hypothetical protein